jgi:hypothetical protein
MTWRPPTTNEMLAVVVDGNRTLEARAHVGAGGRHFTPGVLPGRPLL